jgi:hypothetical protein
MTDTAKERADLKRKLAASERVGDGYKARIAAIRKRLDELDMKEAGQ